MTTSRIVTGSHLLSQALKHEGVKTVFTLAGDHVLPALDVMADEDFRFIDTRHEQGAVHMADAWGRLTGGPGVAMYTTPGFANAIPGLANAMHTGSPLISISGSAELNELGRGAMQEINQIGMAQPTTKGAWMVTAVNRIPDMVAHAARVAYSGRRGPVHLTIPVDVQQQEVSLDDVHFYSSSEYRSTAPAVASEDQVRAVVELLKGASKPLIIVGSAGAYSQSGEALESLIETTRVPLMTEGDARGLVTDAHPYCYGFFDSALNQAAKLLREADVVVLMGRKQDLIVGYAMAPVVSPDATVIQIDPSEAEIGRNRGVGVGIVGDISAVAQQLADEAAKHSWSDLPWLKQLEAARVEQDEMLSSLGEGDYQMHAMQVHKEVRKHIGPDDFLTFDGGDFCHFGRAYLPALAPHRWWYVSTLGMLGSSLPTAIAAKVAYPDSKVFAFTGDGAFGFNGMEFDTAVRHNLAVVGIMGNDSAWGIDRQIQMGVYGKAVATDLLPTRYDQVVRGLGGYGEQVESLEELPSALVRVIKLERPALLNVQVQNAISPRAQAAVDRWKSHTPQPF
ncbi:MAG: thiamine pyrophosphate-binding protein [SAR202 cluster bacterium]|nr:thiamine pyrophosphate-binding protein [SAR202 cluster bacterium]